MSNLLENYTTDPGFDPAEDYIGPFYYRRLGDEWHFAFLAEHKHCNAFDTIHGGVLMTFADFSLCLEATNHYDGLSCATVSFNSEFVAAGKLGDLVQAKAETVRKTNSLAFVRGDVFTKNNILIAYSAVVKLFPDKSA